MLPCICSEMPLYFLTSITTGPKSNEQGEELADQHAAWKEATTIAGQTIQDLDGRLKPGRELAHGREGRVPKYVFVLQISAKKPRSC
jgi:hypothetical protein